MGLGIGRKIKKYGKRAAIAFSTGGFSELYRGLKPKGSSDYASQLRAKIAREQWADYKTRFQPLEDKLLNFASNKENNINKARADAAGRVETMYGGAQGQTERRLQSYGLQITPEVQGRISKRLGLDKSLANVQAQNMAARDTENQMSGIVGGGLSLGARNVSGNR